MAITLTGMRVLVAVAEAGTVAGAAERLGRGAPAISMALKQLEDELGGPLFEGDRKSTLSDLGRFAYETARAGLQRYDLAVGNIKAYAAGTMGRLKVACVPSVASFFLPDIIDRFVDRYPKVQLDIRDTDTAWIEAAVLGGEIDVGIAAVPRDTTQIVFTPLFEDRFVVVCSGDDPLSSQKAVTLQDLMKRTVIGNGASANLENQTYRLMESHSQLMVRNMASLFAMIRRNVGVTLLPQLSVPQDDGSLRCVPISGERLVRTVGIHRRAGVAFSPTAGAFADVLSRYVAEQLETDHRIWAPSTV